MLIVKIKESPILFIKLWCIPAILHHIVFRVLIKIGPILYFFGGIFFTFALLIYLLLIAFNVPLSEYRQQWHHLHPPKDMNIEKKLKYMKQGFLEVEEIGETLNCPNCFLKIKSPHYDLL